MSENQSAWFTPEAKPDDERLQYRLKEAVKRSPRYVRLAANMARDDRVPTRAKAALIVGGAYVVSPIDLVPGIIPVLGQIDDLIVIMLALGAATRMCPPQLVEEHLAAVNLSSLDVTRDSETARMAGKWAARKGLHAARSVASKGFRLARGAARRGRLRTGEWRTARQLGEP